uniref:Uncharacterized protein n=1 Tax=Romanomermis culicivorax TaxID=13658 RepID=A0A915HUM5_ROMCU
MNRINTWENCLRFEGVIKTRGKRSKLQLSFVVNGPAAHIKLNSTHVCGDCGKGNGNGRIFWAMNCFPDGLTPCNAMNLKQSHGASLLDDAKPKLNKTSPRLLRSVYLGVAGFNGTGTSRPPTWLRAGPSGRIAMLLSQKIK